eukprot:3644258-Ditylum_brightwellii.AAC.1
MPGYVKTALHKYQHPSPRHPEHSPHQFEAPKFSKQPQYAPTSDMSALLNDDEKKHLQGLLETLLYYARAVDPTMPMAINTIAAQQANPTIDIAKDMVHLLNYCSMHPDAVLSYSASGMILHIHSDALYLSKTVVRSRAGGHFFLSSASEDQNKPPTAPVPLNGPIHTVCKILCTVIASATEAEIGALFINTCKGEELRLAHKEMGHPQLPTP